MNSISSSSEGGEARKTINAASPARLRAGRTRRLMVLSLAAVAATAPVAVLTINRLRAADAPAPAAVLAAAPQPAPAAPDALQEGIRPYRNAPYEEAAATPQAGHARP